MQKYILLLIFILSSTDTIFSQERTVLYADDTLKIIHDFYENKPFKGFYLYPSTSIYYTIEPTKNDTFSLAFSKPLGKAYYDGKYFTIIDEYLDYRSQTYAIFGRKDKGWHWINYHSVSRSDFETIIQLEQLNMYQIRELRSKDGKERLLEFDFDNSTNSFSAYKRIDEKRIPVELKPFSNFD